MARLNLRTLATEIANIGNDPYHFVYMGILRPQEVIAPRDGVRTNYELFDKVENDCHAGAVLQKRKMAVIARPFRVNPGGKRRIDKLAAEEVQRQLEGLGYLQNSEVVVQAPGFDSLTLNMLDGILKGFSVSEIMWERRGNRIVAAEARQKPQERFVFKALDGPQGGYELRLLTRDNLYEGEQLPPRKFVVFSYGSKIGNPYGLGLGLKLYWPVWFKRQGMTFWLQFLERYASPTPVATYAPGTPELERKKILNALASLAQGSPAAFPDGANPSFLEAGHSGTDAYHTIMGYLDEEISKAVLGETMTTNHKGAGSGQALGMVHNEVRTELTKADADLQCGALNVTLCRWITELNFPGAAIPTVERVFEDKVDQASTATAWNEMVAVGYRPKIEEVKRVFGEDWEPIPAAPTPAAGPGGDNTVRGQVAVKPGEGGEGGAQGDNGGPTGQFAEAIPGAEGPDKLIPWVEQVVAAAAPSVNGMVEEVRVLVKKAKSLEDLRDSLLEAFPKLDAAAFAEVMQKAMVLGHLAGRYDVAKGA